MKSTFTVCPVDHDTLKSTPSLWDEYLVNRRSQAVMIPGTDCAECAHCHSTLTLVVDQQAYDDFWAEEETWEQRTRDYSADRDPSYRPGFVGVAA